MKKIFVIMILASLITFTLSGCTRETEEKTYAFKDSVESGFPKISIYKINNKPSSDIRFAYAVDDRTNLVYIMGYGVYKMSMTPAYNEDGTIMTKDQLLDMEEEDANVK